MCALPIWTTKNGNSDMLDKGACAVHPQDTSYGDLVDDLEEVARINLRVLSSQASKKQPLTLFVPKRQPLELLFFRLIFVQLRDAMPPELADSAKADSIPVVAFQRAFERLFFLLRDPQGFDAEIYDANKNGYVQWSEFCYVFKKRRITVNLSVSERIYLTFDAPESSVMAQVVSAIVLMTIVVSSLCFILSTVPEFQEHPSDGSKPKPKAIFETIEYACLLLFVLEYLTRLSTCATVRYEVFDKPRLLELVTGSNIINLSSPIVRFVSFVVAPANLVDLAAILPAVISLFGAGSGQGLVVLRLIRLTRIFRAFKNPKIKEPVIVIARTIRQSTKALYVLAFNLMLGIVISSSLMYLAEGGDWDRETRTFKRYVGQSWNNETDKWEDVLEQSPFLSIPRAFWWAIVTATTVGYGDDYPTTSLGYVIATIFMTFSLVVLALPVGVIGGTFTQVWHDFHLEKKEEELLKQRENTFITGAMQHIDPMSMSRMMLVEVWNDRIPPGNGGKPSHEPWISSGGNPLRPPHAGEFMGLVKVDLELSPVQSVSRTLTLPLQGDEELIKRRITGNITLSYEWTPDTLTETIVSAARDSSPDGGDSQETAATSCGTKCWTKCAGGSMSGQFHGEAASLMGKLKVSILSADRLVNLNCSTAHSASSPYCLVHCYPTPPAGGESICPYVWRTPTAPDTLSPRWKTVYMFDVRWSGVGTSWAVCSESNVLQYHSWRKGVDSSLDRNPSKQGVICSSPVENSPRVLPGSDNPLEAKVDEVLRVVLEMRSEMRSEVRQLREEVRRLSASSYADASRLHLGVQPLSGAAASDQARMDGWDMDGVLPGALPA